MVPSAPSLGDLLRQWRQRRRLSQLELALDAGISTRHLSYLETGRSRPSRAMVLMLAAELDLPLRERNLMLLAAGFAPVFSERALDDPELAAARRAVDLVLRGHEPYPALALDRRWVMVAANAAVPPLLRAASWLLVPPVNLIRLSLHPEGLAPCIANLAEWRACTLDRLSRRIEETGDADLAALLDEVERYPAAGSGGLAPRASGVAVPLRLRTPMGELSFITTTTAFGAARDVTLSELTIEALFPADAATEARLKAMPR